MVRIRLRRVGSRHQPHYRVVIADKESLATANLSRLSVITIQGPNQARSFLMRKRFITG